MSDNANPVDPDEFVLRRIPEAPGFYDAQKAPPVLAGAFRPSTEDDDGLSFYLERETSAKQLAASGRAGKVYAVSRMRAGDIYELGLTLIPDQKDGGLPGHLIMPEINSRTYNDANLRNKVKESCKYLSEIASKGLVDLAGMD